MAVGSVKQFKKKISTVPCSYKCLLPQRCTSAGSNRSFDVWQRSGKHFHNTSNNILKLFVVASVQDPLPPSHLLPSPSPPVVPPHLLWKHSVSWACEPVLWFLLLADPEGGRHLWPGSTPAPFDHIARAALPAWPRHGHDRKRRSFWADEKTTPGTQSEASKSAQASLRHCWCLLPWRE